MNRVVARAAGVDRARFLLLLYPFFQFCLFSFRFTILTLTPLCSSLALTPLLSFGHLLLPRNSSASCTFSLVGPCDRPPCHVASHHTTAPHQLRRGAASCLSKQLFVQATHRSASRPPRRHSRPRTYIILRLPSLLALTPLPPTPWRPCPAFPRRRPTRRQIPSQSTGKTFPTRPAIPSAAPP